MTKLTRFRAAVVAGVLSVGMATASSSQAQVVIGGGLVNVQITNISVRTGDILSQNTVGVNVNAAVQIVAQVCGISVLPTAVVGTTCDATVGQVTRVINVISQ
jgi:hypothetical protein